MISIILGFRSIFIDLVTCRNPRKGKRGFKIRLCLQTMGPCLCVIIFITHREQLPMALFTQVQSCSSLGGLSQIVCESYRGNDPYQKCKVGSILGAVPTIEVDGVVRAMAVTNKIRTMDNVNGGTSTPSSSMGTCWFE